MSLNKHVIHTVLTQLPSLFVSLVVSTFISRILGPEGRGIYTLFQVNIQFAALLLGTSLSYGFVYFIANQRLETKSLLGIACYLLSLGSLLVAAVILMVMTVLEQWKGAFLPLGFDSIYYAAYFAGSFFLTILNSMLSAVFQGFKKFGTVNRMTVVNSVFNLAAFGLAFLLVQADTWELGVAEIFALSLAVLGLNSLLWVRHYVKEIRVIPSLRISWRQDVIPFSRYIGPGHLSNILNFLNYRMDIWIVAYYCDLTHVGLYSLAVNVSQLVWLIANPIATVLLPYLSESDRQVKQQMLQLYSRLNGTGVLMAAGLIFFMASWVIPLVYGEAFAPSVILLQILLGGIVFSAFSKPIAIFLASENKVRYNLRSTTVGLLFTMVLDFWWIPKYGIIGASWATSAAYTAAFFYMFYNMISKTPMKVANYFLLTIPNVQTLKKQWVK